MNTWTKQKGYPVLNVTRDGLTYTITQERFLTDPDAYDKPDEVSPYDYKWEIPITYIKSGSNVVSKLWFELEAPSLAV